MEIIGIIAEYNPFHNGHKYHIEQIKKLYKDSVIIAVVSSCFTQRGQISILNKWDKTKIALDNNIDIVVELPASYATQSADIFAKAALTILNNLNVTKIVFGSECNNINKLKEIANIQVNNQEFDKKVKTYIEKGNNYPTAISKALEDFKIEKISDPNDLLGVSYIKEIIKNDYQITPITIKRTNNYHGKNKGNILSATEIREKLQNNKNIKKYINYPQKLLYKNPSFFNLLQYQIITNNNLKNIITIDEGIENRISKNIQKANNIEELIKLIKTKRYTYNRINRMFIHILTNLTKENKNLNIDYIRILGFNEKGRKYLNSIKKTNEIKIITKYKDINSPLLQFEKKANDIYSLIVNDKSLIKKEISKPIYIKK